MKIYEAIVVGGGPSGISCAYHLKNQNIDYLLIEQKEMLQTWKNERWDSFYLVTPNWMTNLPGVEHLIPYDNAYMSRSEIEHVLIEYMNYVDPNYVDNTVITSIDKMTSFYRLNTNKGVYYAKSIIVAVGMFNQPLIPSISSGIPNEINQIHSVDYYNPEQLVDGASLVVGAGRSGVQIALELKQERPFDCYLSVGSLAPLPTIYRNVNGVYWLNRLSGFKEGNELLSYKNEDLSNENIVNKLNQNLYNCKEEGVQILGRLSGADQRGLDFEDNLDELFKSGELYKKKIEEKVNDLLKNEVIHTEETTITLPFCELNHQELEVITRLDYKTTQIRNIIWCTGFRPDYSWLTLDIYDQKGQLDLIDDVCTREKVYFCGMGLQPDPDTKTSFGVGLFALVESAKRAVEIMIKELN